jgi:two-component system CheB/CheR fusion protein
MIKKSKGVSRKFGAAQAGKLKSADIKKLKHDFKQQKATTPRIEKTSHELHQKIEAVHGKARLARPQTAKGQGKRERRGAKFPIVGIGASAGGLEAMTQLLKNLPADTDMAFVLVQHLDPTHESALSSLLARATTMPVTEARNNIRLEPNQVYIIPPNKHMGISARRLKLFPRRGNGGQEHMLIDLFFHSLAEQEGGNAVGIILSGSGTDGTQGLLAIKAAGGITFAQEEKGAKYPAMPGNAITAGCVDFVLSAEQMGAELKRIGGHLSIAGPGEKPEEPLTQEKAFESILMVLRQRTGVDFTYYKHATLRRRIHRRMTLHKLASLKDYGDYLRGHSAEVKELFNDVLIHVTGFFRDPEVFQTLRKRVIPKLLKEKGREESLRIWIPGCSTGEEVYSVAISLVELMAEKKTSHPVQIFATDINESALERARAGLYRENIKSEVSAERLRRFFVKEDGGYRVNKTIREMCIFARQNLVNDPPFSNLDLISCRNVLIYLGPTLQHKVIPVFHYALRPSGLLMLGSSETIGAFSNLFSLLDKKVKIYTKKGVHSRPAVIFGREMPQPVRSNESEVESLQVSPMITEVQKQADRIVLTSYSLPGVVINSKLDVLQFRGRTGTFLEHAHGEATLNLLKMAREGLMPALRTIMDRTIKENVRARQEGLRVRQNGHFVQCAVEIIPFTVPPGQETFYLVLFDAAFPVAAEIADRKTEKTIDERHRENTELAHLREELSATRESLQTIIEEQGATNEELRSANEEIMSSNEELQSTNEELETAKEELQSTNEELTTLNDELENRNGELEQVNNDLHNLLASVNIPVVILGADLQIRRFTAMAEKMFNLIPGDIGRPITDIALPLNISSLDKKVLEVLDSLTPGDIEVEDKKGHWWCLRIRPYKTVDHKIEGAVIALLDVDVLKNSALNAAGARDFAEAIVNTVREPLLVLDRNLTVKSANQAFYKMFKMSSRETAGRRIYELDNKQWNIPRLRVLLEGILKRDNSFNDFEVEHDFRQAGKKRLLLNGRRLALAGDSDEMILLAIEEK